MCASGRDAGGTCLGLSSSAVCALGCPSWGPHRHPAAAPLLERGSWLVVSLSSKWWLYLVCWLGIMCARSHVQQVVYVHVVQQASCMLVLVHVVVRVSMPSV